MKLNYLATLSATTILTVSLVGGTLVNQAFASPASTNSATPILAEATMPSGNFVAAEHPTLGMARVVTENGQRYLEFDEEFQTDNGPDLFVLLHRQGVPKSYQAENYLSLGRLKQVSGTQRYAIPADADITDFNSVVIWCRQFNATFGYATFGS